MTAKQLKEWAAGIPDHAVIETREKGYARWNDEFALRATTETVLESSQDEQPTAIEDTRC